MRGYAICWTVVVALLAAAAGAAAFAVSGWQTVAVTAACAAVLGAMVGVVWAEEAGRRMVLRCVGWSLVAALLVVGLPMLLDAWSLLVLGVLVLSAPPLVASAVQALHLRRAGPVEEPERTSGRGPAGRDAASDRPLPALPEHVVTDVTLMTDRELERRWHVTSARLRHPGTTADATMRLVAERIQLLDEIERRNPEHFAAIVDRAIGLSDERDGGTNG